MAQDWELTSAHAASIASDEVSTTQQPSGSQGPFSKDNVEAIEAATLAENGTNARVPRGSQPGSAASAGTSAFDALGAVSDTPESVRTSIVNGVLETGAKPDAQQRPEDLAQAKFWDRQIAEGKLSMLSKISLMHVNIMAWGESGLGKTVSHAAGNGDTRALAPTCTHACTHAQLSLTTVGAAEASTACLYSSLCV